MDELPPADDLLDVWDAEPDEDELAGPPPWRRPLLVIVAAVTAVALAVVPLSNLFGRNPQLSDTGLELCRFDYCVVHEAMVDAGVLPVMGRLHNTFLSDEETGALAEEIAGFLGVEPVSVRVVDRLERRLGGAYQPSTRTVFVRRPVRAWIVAHEMAHVVSLGHGEDFIDTLVAIARWWDEGR